MSDIDYEKVDWEDEPSTQTSVSRRNLGKMDDALYRISKKLDKTSEIILQSSGWISSGESQYPYKLFSAIDKFEDDDHPLCQVWGVNEIETEDELNCIKMVKKVIVDHTGVTVYASDRPTVNLKMILRA